MTLLDELQGLNVSGVVNARASISASFNDADLQALLKGGAAQTALASLGASMQSLRDSVHDPADLLKPLVGALSELSGPLHLDGAPIGKYTDAVREGATIIAGVFEGLSGDPAALGKSLGKSLGDTINLATSTISGFSSVDLSDLGSFRSLVDLVERGIPADPQAIADLAMRLLLPFPHGRLITIRTNIDVFMQSAGTISLPQTRTAALVASLDAVANAAITADARVLQRAITDFERVRNNTLTTMREDLLRAFQLIDGLHMDRTLNDIADVGSTIRIAGQDVLQFMNSLRAALDDARTSFEELDPKQIMAFVKRFLDALEAEAHNRIVVPIEQQVERLKQWVRNLLRHLPLRELRHELSKIIHAIAKAIEDADLDQYVRAVHNMLHQLQSTVESANLGADVRATIQKAEQTITNTLNKVVSALETIGNEINAVANQAKAILEKLADALDKFQQVIDGIVHTAENLGIDQAGQQVVDTLRQLRETAEKLLSVAPLPESMRPLVQQLIDTIQGIDLDEVVFKPVREAVKEFHIPDSVGASIKTALQKASDALHNLIPADLVNSIKAEIEAGLNTIRNFNPGSLLDGVKQYIDEAATFVEGLDPTAALAQLHAPYQAILDSVDVANPYRLLAPVIEAYNALLGKIPVPSPETGTRQIASALGTAGESMGRAIAAPIQQLAPAGAIDIGGASGGSAGSSDDPATLNVRAGDIIRMFGYLPNKLREALQALEAGRVGEVLHIIDNLIGALARDLRRLQAVIWEIDSRLDTDLNALLAPLARAQFNAQLAIQTHFTAEAGGSSASIDVKGMLQSIALADPGAMRLALSDSINTARGKARSTASLVARNDTLERIADALERTTLFGIVHDVDTFLAALDPEPLAAAFDQFVTSILSKAPALLKEIDADLDVAVSRLKRMFEEFNPTMQAQKFLRVLDVLREELDVLNPARLAAELSEIHGAIRDTIVAYDPAALAASIKAVITAVAASLRSLNPADLLGDLSFLNPILAKIEAASPANALEGVGTALKDVGERLAKLDPDALLDTVNHLPERIEAEFEKAIKAIKDEIIALLESLKYASTNASATISVSASAEVG